MRATGVDGQHGLPPIRASHVNRCHVTRYFNWIRRRRPSQFGTLPTGQADRPIPVVRRLQLSFNNDAHERCSVDGETVPYMVSQAGRQFAPERTKQLAFTPSHSCVPCRDTVAPLPNNGCGINYQATVVMRERDSAIPSIYRWIHDVYGVFTQGKSKKHSCHLSPVI